MTTATPSPSSFRDPSGFIFSVGGVIYRQINVACRGDFDALISSGLYDELTKAGLLVSHAEVDPATRMSDAAYKVIRPERIPFISYPYEWSFSQFRAAALCTLDIQKRAVARGMSLKDCSAYNIQFVGHRPVFIDTLSFEKYREGEPWVAYRQFCQHFLAPLALMAHVDVRLSSLLRSCIDGIPLDLTARLLPHRSVLDLSLLMHIHAHAKSQRAYAGKRVSAKGHHVGKMAFLGIVDSLESAVRKLRWKPGTTEWGDYYAATNYSEGGVEAKKGIVAGYVRETSPGTVWDLGGNTGLFSRVAAETGARVVSFDVDPLAVERNYQQAVKEKNTSVLPLVLDLTNPSPAIGWDHSERASLLDRGPADMAMALALIHHLAISNNVPLDRIAAFLARCCRWLIIEFVPKSDSQVQRLLASRVDIFPQYTQDDFERVFAGHFATLKKTPVADSERMLYLLERTSR
jgi:ribosomal protein L11 methylase PrmA